MAKTKTADAPKTVALTYQGIDTGGVSVGDVWFDFGVPTEVDADVAARLVEINDGADFKKATKTAAREAHADDAEEVIAADEEAMADIVDEPIIPTLEGD